MTTPDDILGEKVEHTVDDGEGGQWLVSMRPRREGPPVVDASMVSFRRPSARIAGFGVRVWALRDLADIEKWRDWVAETSIRLTHESAKNTLAWLETVQAEGEVK